MKIYFLCGHSEENGCDRNSTNVLNFSVKFNNGELTRSVYVKPIDRHQHLYLGHLIRTILNGQLFSAKLYWEVVYDHCEKIKTSFSKQGSPDKIIENEMNVNFGKSRSEPNLPQECLSLLHITPDSKT